MLNLETQKVLGRTYLNSNQIGEALEICSSILREHPEDVDSLVFLGDCFLADGDCANAFQVYRLALELSEDKHEVEQRLVLAKAELSLPNNRLVNSNPTRSAIIQHLGRRLEAGVEFEEQELSHAAGLLEKVTNSDQPASVIVKQINDIERLILALIELNIREAQANGSRSLVAQLQTLMQDVQSAMPVSFDQHINNFLSENPGEVKILLLADDIANMDTPFDLALSMMEYIGYQFEFSSDTSADQLELYDLVLAHNPHHNLSKVKVLAACSGHNIPIVLYVDDDFGNMPETDRNYGSLAINDSDTVKNLEVVLALSDQICVPSDGLANRFRQRGYKVGVIPPGWDQKDLKWTGEFKSDNDWIDIGWVGPQDELADVAGIKRVILRVLEQFPQTRLVIGDSSDVYKIFDSLDENRRIYLPDMDGVDQPHVIRQMDILLMPLRSTPFNETKTDKRLMEAGILEKPWIASSISSALGWAEGGLIANNIDDWYAHLLEMITNPSMRSTLAQEGNQKATAREVNVWGNKWRDVMYSVLA